MSTPCLTRSFSNGTSKQTSDNEHENYLRELYDNTERIFKSIKTLVVTNKFTIGYKTYPIAVSYRIGSPNNGREENQSVVYISLADFKLELCILYTA